MEVTGDKYGPQLKKAPALVVSAEDMLSCRHNFRPSRSERPHKWVALDSTQLE